MVPFLLKRIFSLALVLIGVITVTFVLLRKAPGDPFVTGDKAMSEQAKQALLEKMHLDGSLTSQIWRYYQRLATGDLGPSIKYEGWSVSEIMAQSLPVSFRLGGTALLIAVVMGLIVGGIAAVRKNSWPDWLCMGGALAGVSLPPFVTGPLLVFVFALTLKWFPIGGWFAPRTLWLPAICLAAPSIASIARLTRNSLLDVLNQDFIRTAKAILPVVTLLGPLAANLLTGSVVVEAVFGVPGAGQYFVRSIENRDLFLLLGVVIIYCTLLVIFNAVVDLSYRWLDKRIALQ
jgi:oligopeptide transport system permease protein